MNEPCPFCRGSDLDLNDDTDEGADVPSSRFVICNNADCMAEGPIAQTAEGAWGKWNETAL